MTNAEQNKRAENFAKAIAALIVVVGLTAFTRGASLAWRPAGWMFAGAAISLPAFFWLYNAVRRSGK